MFARLINSLEEGVISLLLVALALVIVFEIATRLLAPALIGLGYLPNILWAEELTLTIAAWMVLFGASYGVKVGSHIGADVIVRLLPDRWRRIAGLFAVGLCLVYCALFLYASWEMVKQGFDIGIEMEELPVPEWVAESILLIGFSMLFVRFAQLGLAIIQGKTMGFHLADEASEALEELAENRFTNEPGGEKAVNTPGGEKAVNTPGGEKAVNTPGGEKAVNTPGGGKATK